MRKTVMRSFISLAMAFMMAFFWMPEVNAAAVEIDNSKTSEGADAYTMTVGQKYETMLNGEAGYVSFVTPAEEGFIAVEWENLGMEGTQRCYLRDANGKLIAEYSGDKGYCHAWEFKSETGRRNRAEMEPGTRYYIQIGETEAQPNGKAGLMVRFAADDCPDGMKGAKEVSAGTPYTGVLNGEKSTDNDCYCFVPFKTAIHRITVKNVSKLSEIRYHVYDSNGSTLESVYGGNGGSAYGNIPTYGAQEKLVDVRLEAGKTYYLSIDGNKGTYSFDINCQTVESISMTASVTLKYDGDEYQLKPTVLPENAFKRDLEYSTSNYEVATVDDKGVIKSGNAGKAVITATAKDESGVSAQCIVYVKPEAPDNPQVVSSTTSSIKIKWDAVKMASDYTVYQKKNGKWKKLGTTKKKTYTVKKLKSATCCQFKIQANMKMDGKTFSSAKSETGYAATKPKSTTITKFTRLAKKKRGSATYYGVKIHWKKLAGVKKYTIYYKLPGDNKIKELGNYSGTSATAYLEWYSGSKKCTFYVQPYIMYKDEVYNGARSKGKTYTFK